MQSRPIAYAEGAYQSFAEAKPIIISPGDFSGAGKEYRYPLGEGLFC